MSDWDNSHYYDFPPNPNGDDNGPAFLNVDGAASSEYASETPSEGIGEDGLPQPVMFSADAQPFVMPQGRHEGGQNGGMFSYSGGFQPNVVPSYRAFNPYFNQSVPVSFFTK